jgi:hypothetical protein
MLSRLRFWAEHDIAPWSPKPRQESSIRVPKREKVRGFRTVAVGVRGNSTSIVVDPNDGYAKILGSNIEHNAFMAFCADPTVKSIVCQAPGMEWVDEDGVVHEHFFDFLVQLHSGYRKAVMCKKAEKARHDRLEDFAALLAEQMPPGFADEVVLLTDEDMPAWLVANARLIHSARLDEAPGFNADAATCVSPLTGLDAVVADRAGQFADPVPVSTLLEPIGEEGFRSVARLVFKGVLAPVEAQARIGWDTLVCKAA